MKTVLIVEDDPLNVTVFSRILTRRGGLAVKHTEDVEEVLQIVQSKEADIILMDIDLANSYYQGKAVNGIEIVQMLKANPQTATVPVILVTARALEGDRENFSRRVGQMAIFLNL
jgi:CheY-like chemotaxis protein